MADQNVDISHDKNGNWWYYDVDKGEILHEKPYKTEKEARKGMTEYMKKQGIAPSGQPKSQKEQLDWVDKYAK